MWSVGCIFAELLARNALFPGEDYIAQLRLICEKMGRPPADDLDFVTSERAKAFISSLPPSKPIEMSDLFPAHKNENTAFGAWREIGPLWRERIRCQRNAQGRREEWFLGKQRT
jgi:hypothetical protein